MRSITFKAEGQDEPDFRPTDEVWRRVLNYFIETDLLDPSNHDNCDYTIIIYSPARAEYVRQEEGMEELPFGEWGWVEEGFESFGIVVFERNGRLEGEA